LEDNLLINSLISVVMPTYQRPQYIGQAIESVLNQTYSNWELLIIDDNLAGDDYRKSTGNVIEDYLGDNRIKYIKNAGSANGAIARNAGIREARGEFIAFLDDDDLWEPEKLQLQFEVFRNEDVGLVYCKRFFFNDQGERCNKPQKDLIRGNVFKEMLGKHYIATCTAMVKRECFDRVGLFDEKLPSRQDHDMFLRIAQFYKIGLVEKALVGIRIHPVRISRNPDKKNRGWELFLKKWDHQFARYPSLKKKLYSYYHFEMGKIYYYHGDFSSARKHLYKTTKYNFFHYKSWILLFLTLIGYRMIRLK
jgi:glycosyltransferase involved in cell wall biosynthesis